MKKENYYALINYRGKVKYYYVSASHPEYGIRVEYIDYNPNREWGGVWISNGQDRIIKKFDSNSDEFKYFTELHDNWDKLCHEHAEREQKHYNTENISYAIGTLNFLKYFKEALKETPNTLGIIL